MLAVIQRALWARVSVECETVAVLGAPPAARSDELAASLPAPGLVVLLAVGRGDDEAVAAAMAAKIWQLRVLADDQGRMNLSLSETGGGVVVVSQFTLLGDTSRGRRPSWAAAAAGEVAAPLVHEVVERLAQLGAPVAEGRFGAHMTLELANDGPVTVTLDVPPR